MFLSQSIETHVKLLSDPSSTTNVGFEWMGSLDVLVWRHPAPSGSTTCRSTNAGDLHRIVRPWLPHRSWIRMLRILLHPPFICSNRRSYPRRPDVPCPPHLHLPASGLVPGIVPFAPSHPSWHANTCPSNRSDPVRISSVSQGRVLVPPVSLSHDRAGFSPDPMMTAPRPLPLGCPPRVDRCPTSTPHAMDHVICVGARFPRPHPRPSPGRVGVTGRGGGANGACVGHPGVPSIAWVAGTQRLATGSDERVAAANDARGGRGSATCKSKPRSEGPNETKDGG